MIEEIKVSNSKTIDYLKQILDKELLIANPTSLDIPGIGEGTATSMVQDTERHGEFSRYFSFKIKDKKIEFHRRRNEYYMEALK